MLKHIFAASFALATLSLSAEVNIDFESNSGYTNLNVYDVWEESPFRTGALSGNWAITPNPDTEVNEIIGEAPNPSATVLGAQRSRFGSNRFGVRIDLAEPFHLTATPQYVHVMLHKPKAGRVMLVGLGSRDERMDQNPYCEQFWQTSVSGVEPGMWSDAVFPIKGVAGITIRSLVIVPDLESPHNLAEDFLFYVDNIEVNTSSLPRVNYEYYPVIGTKENSAMTRTNRVTDQISIKIGDETQSAPIAQQSNKKLYQDLTATTFYAQRGQTITPEIHYKQDWMHAYCYIDFNNDGKFSAELNADGTPAAGSELVAFNGYSTNGNDFKNSKGENTDKNQGNNSGKIPSFTLPADMAPGRYRMRLKLDWNSLDPMGNPGDAEGKNLINDNGGMIADVMLNVCDETVTVNDFQLNGEIVAADGSKLTPYQAPYNQPFTIKMIPADGFHHDGIDVKLGFNLDGEKTDKYGNPQYEEFYIPGFLFGDGLYTIPAEQMRGNLLLNGRMIDDNAQVEESKPYAISFPEDLAITRTDRKLNSVTLATSGSDPDLKLTPSTQLVYQNFLTSQLDVKAGETVTPTVNYTGRAMHGYWYVDIDENGVFSTNVNSDGTPAGEMLSYSYSNGKNSLGESISAPGNVSPSTNHPFAIPETTSPGLYRGRYKIDWNYEDPAGQYGRGSNDIHDNGGYVVDYMIHVHGSEVAVTTELQPQFGTALLTANGEALGQSVTYNTAIELSGLTDNGSEIKTLNVKYGYHLDKAAAYMGHTYWHIAEITPDSNGKVTIPAEITKYPMVITGEFTQTQISEINAAANSDTTIYDLQGRRLAKPANGVNIINGRKVLVKPSR